MFGFFAVSGLFWLGGGIFLGIVFKDPIMKVYLGSEAFANKLQAKAISIKASLGKL